MSTLKKCKLTVNDFNGYQIEKIIASFEVGGVVMKYIEQRTQIIGGKAHTKWYVHNQNDVCVLGTDNFPTALDKYSQLINRVPTPMRSVHTDEDF